MGFSEIGGDVRHLLIAIERDRNGPLFEVGSSQSQAGFRVSAFQCARKRLHGFVVAAKLQRCNAPTVMGFRQIGGNVRTLLIAIERAGSGSPVELGSSQSQAGLGMPAL